VGGVSDGGNAVFKNIERKKERTCVRRTQVLCSSDHVPPRKDLLPRDLGGAAPLRDRRTIRVHRHDNSKLSSSLQRRRTFKNQ